MKKVKIKFAKRFSNFAAETMAEVVKRQADPSNPLYNTPVTNAKGHLKITLFSVISKWLHEGKLEKIKKFALRNHHSAKGMQEENDYEWGVIAFYSMLGPIDNSLQKDIRLTAGEFLHARDQSILPEDLIGALYQLGGASKIQKLLRTSHPALFKSVRKSPTARPTRSSAPTSRPGPPNPRPPRPSRRRGKAGGKSGGSPRSGKIGGSKMGARPKGGKNGGRRPSSRA